jgi:carbon storage regulator
MLVLSRKVGEEIVIGGDIRVRVVSIQGNQVRLGFAAPLEVKIKRQELLESNRFPRPDDTVVEDAVAEGRNS